MYPYDDRVHTIGPVASSIPTKVLLAQYKIYMAFWQPTSTPGRLSYLLVETDSAPCCCERDTLYSRETGRMSRNHPR